MKMHRAATGAATAVAKLNADDEYYEMMESIEGSGTVLDVNF